MSEPDEYNKKTRARLDARREIDAQTGCWIYRGAETSNGYRHMSFHGRAEYPHRVAAIIFLGYDPASGLIVMHECDTPPCFNPDHLLVGTQKQNMAAAAARGRMGAHKLTPTMVAQIKYELAGGATTRRELAVRYGVSTTTIRQIATGETWRGVRPASDANDPTTQSDHRDRRAEPGDNAPDRLTEESQA